MKGKNMNKIVLNILVIFGILTFGTNILANDTIHITAGTQFVIEVQHIIGVCVVTVIFTKKVSINTAKKITISAMKHAIPFRNGGEILGLAFIYPNANPFEHQQIKLSKKSYNLIIKKNTTNIIPSTF